MFSEPTEVDAFRKWLALKGAYIHPSLKFVKDRSGMSIHAVKDIRPDSRVISCPFTLAIGPDSSKNALVSLSEFGSNRDAQLQLLDTLSERELICTYIVMHWILEDGDGDLQLENITAFEHLPYLHVLPPVGALRTALHFNEKEMTLFRGTNVYGATMDRRAERETEWQRCRKYVGSIRQKWEDGFTWQRYFTATTYLSSRAFPSTILSTTPSLVSTESSHPVLFPGLDSLNHARARSVSWVIDEIQPNISSSPPPHPPSPMSHTQISLVVHTAVPAEGEIFNNYGPKPNSELILGYGFSLPSNPDDTIVLKIGGRPGDNSGSSSKRWEVGRDAGGAEGLWDELKGVFANEIEHEEDAPIMEWEIELEAAETLRNMVEQKTTALPRIPDNKPEDVRKEVFQMAQHYVQGQEDILRALSAFADTKREGAVAKAKWEGIELVFEEAEDVT